MKKTRELFDFKEATIIELEGEYPLTVRYLVPTENKYCIFKNVFVISDIIFYVSLSQVPQML